MVTKDNIYLLKVCTFSKENGILYLNEKEALHVCVIYNDEIIDLKTLSPVKMILFREDMITKLKQDNDIYNFGNLNIVSQNDLLDNTTYGLQLYQSPNVTDELIEAANTSLNTYINTKLKENKKRKRI